MGATNEMVKLRNGGAPWVATNLHGRRGHRVRARKRKFVANSVATHESCAGAAGIRN